MPEPGLRDEGEPRRGDGGLWHDDGEQVNDKNGQQHDAVEDDRAPGSQHQHRHEQREQEQHRRFGVYPQAQAGIRIQRHETDGGNGQSDAGKRRPQGKVETGLQMIRARGPKRGQPFRKQHDAGDDHSDQRFRGSHLQHRRLEAGGQLFRQQHHRYQAHQQEAGARGRYRIARQRRVLRRLLGLILLQKVLPVADRLGKDECAIDHERHDGDQYQLTGGIVRPGRGHGVVGKNQRHDHDGRQCNQRRTDAVEAEGLFAVREAAHEQTQADDAVQNDHYGREYRVARQAGRFLPTRGHQRHDERNLDQRNRKRQYQGAIGFARPLGDHFGMMDGGEDARGKTQRYEGDDNSADSDSESGGEQYGSRKQRGGDGPNGNSNSGVHRFGYSGRA